MASTLYAKNVLEYLLCSALFYRYEFTQTKEAAKMLRARDFLFSRRGLFFIVLMAALTGAFVYTGGVLLPAGADIDPNSTIALDPMNKSWQTRVVPKQRFVVSYRGTDWSMNSFVGTSEDITWWTEDAKVKITPDVYGAGDNANYVFASSAAEGKILTTVSGVSPDFYGITTFENVPKNVMVSSYLIRHDGGTNAIWLSMREGDSTVGMYQLPKEYTPAYQFKFQADWSWVNAPALDKNTAHDLVAYDWDGDGYSDYVLTYIQADKDTNGGNNANTFAKILLIDGKSLYNKLKNGSGDVIMTHINGDNSSIFSTGANVVGGLTGIKPSNSCRLVKGDFDGDGRPEVALYYTLIHGNGADQSRANQLEVYRINSSSAGVYQGQGIYNTLDGVDGGSLKQNDSVGLAAGDINNDGLDELALIYAESSALSTWADVKMIIYGYANGKMTQLVGVTDIDQDTYKVDSEEDSVSPINAEIADLDGDGFGELVWTSAKDEEGFNLYLFVNKWNSLSTDNKTIFGTGDLYKYCMKSGTSKSVTNIDWALNRTYIHHSLCTGDFEYPNEQTYVKQPQQIAVGHMGSDRGDGAANIDYAVFSWDRNSGLVAQSNGCVWQNSTLMMNGNLGPIVTAVDLYQESMVLGAPDVLTVNNNIELYTAVQTPPRHWDVVSADDSRITDLANSDDTVTMDAFSLFDPDGGKQYYTAMELNGSNQQFSSTTDTSSGTWGVAASYQRNYFSILGDDEREASNPTLKVGAEYSGECVDTNTSAYESKTEHTFTFRTTRDDAVYYVMNNYNICRYPVLFPVSQRTELVSDDVTGKDVELQRYVQYVVPTKVAPTFMPTDGRMVSWYEPAHDTYNLFTYPKRLKDITGYPQGQAQKLAIDPYDPWADFNGKVLDEGTQNTIGNTADSTFKVEALQTITDEHYDSVSHTVAPYVYVHPSWGINGKNQINIDATGSGSWGTETTTSMSTSKMLGATVNWPGSASYTMFTPGWSATGDMSFKTDIAYYTQDDGAFCVGFAIPNLKGEGKMWGNDSPYCTHPDPALNLPFRWSNEVKNRMSDTKMKTTQFYLTENDNVRTRYTLRGITFKKAGGSSASTGEYEEKPLRVLEKGTSYDVTLRTFNLSFVNTEAVTVKFYYQPWQYDKYGAPLTTEVNDPVDKEEVVSLDLIGNDTINFIPGRTGQEDSTNNWKDAKFSWKTPDNEGMGYVHAVIEYAGKQLNAKNDHGYMLVGVYDPTNFSDISEYQSGRAAPAPVTIPDAEKPDLEITSVKAYKINSDGSTGEEVEIKPALRDQKLKIEVTAKFTGGKIPMYRKANRINHLPHLRIAMLAGRRGNHSAVMGATEVPVASNGTVEKVSFIYDPARATASNGLAVLVFSPFLPAQNQKNMTNNSRILWESVESGGSSGGCSAGLAALALLALVPLFGRGLRGKK